MTKKDKRKKGEKERGKKPFAERKETSHRDVSLGEVYVEQKWYVFVRSDDGAILQKPEVLSLPVNAYVSVVEDVQDRSKATYEIRAVKKGMFKRPFSFKGRISRTEYVLSFFLIFGSLFGLFYLSEEKGFAIGRCLDVIGVPASMHESLIIVIFLLSCWFMLAQATKRCRDSVGSGWAVIFSTGCLPLASIFTVFAKGVEGDWEIGPDPRRKFEYIGTLGKRMKYDTLLCCLDTNKDIQFTLMPNPSLTTVHDMLIRLSKEYIVLETASMGYVVVSRYGIFIVWSKNCCSCEIYGDDEHQKWKQRMLIEVTYEKNLRKEPTFRKLHDSGYVFNNPVKLLRDAMYDIRKSLSKWPQVNVVPIVVFAGGAVLDHVTSKIHVIMDDELLETIQGYKKVSLSDTDVDDIVKTLSAITTRRIR